MEPCQQLETLREIKESLKEIKSDVRDILKYKFQIIGAVAMLTFLVSIGFNIYKLVGGF